jgi:hypothetical protein
MTHDTDIYLFTVHSLRHVYRYTGVFGCSIKIFLTFIYIYLSLHVVESYMWYLQWYRSNYCNMCTNLYIHWFLQLFLTLLPGRPLLFNF